ncbi:hypothetical protein [Algoriphagus boritolerans]|nr:hypothetical protein [Algoriphagus boritolerans]
MLNLVRGGVFALAAVAAFAFTQLFQSSNMVKTRPLESGMTSQV